MRSWTVIVAVALAFGSMRPGAAQAPAAQNVVVITIDGLRWQEMFTGADREYFKKEKSGEPGAAEKRFWRATADERRAALLPFVWSTIATKGQIFGDPSKGSRAHVTNGLWFSYPGYNEMFSGAADPGSTATTRCPTRTSPCSSGSTPALVSRGAWRRSARGTFCLSFSTSAAAISRSAAASRPCRCRRPIASARSTSWPRTCRPIGTTGPSTRPSCTPRVLYVMLGEGDEWAHAGRYDLYLDAAFRADRFIRRVGHAAVDAGVRESDDAARHDRPRARRDDERLDRSRPQGAGRGFDVDCRARARRAAARRARVGDRHHVTAGRDDRRCGGRGLQGCCAKAAPPLPVSR